MNRYLGQRTQLGRLSGHHPYPPLCRLSLAVMVAICGLPSDDAMAEGCDRRTTVLGGRNDTACILDDGEQLQVGQGAELSVPGNSAVTLGPGANARQILNNGLIAGRGGLVLTDASLSGKVSNGKTGVIEGSEAVVHIVNSTVGSFANAGRLSLAGGPEVNLPAVLIENSTVNGDINNTGTLEVVDEATYPALSISRSRIKGDIKHSGSIDGYYYGLSIEQTTVDGSFRNSGSISAGAAVRIYSSSFAGDFVNNAEIGSTFALINVRIGGNFINTGDIDGGDFAGIRDSHIAGDVINTGTFEAGSSAYIRADIGGRLVNTGVLSGGAYSFGISGEIRGGIYNSGVIVGGWDFSSALSIGAHTPILVNTGTISSSSEALRIGEGAQIGTLINSGTISVYDEYGFGASLLISEGAQVGSVQIVGDRARFDGRVQAPTVPFFVNPKATYRLLPNDVFEVRSLTNQGTLILAAPTNADAAVPAIIGDYNQAAEGVLRAEVVDTTHYGQLTVSGTATLPTQARIDIDLSQATQPLAPAQLQNVVSAGTLVSDGTFKVTSNSALFNFGAVKDGNTVDLTLAAKSSSGVSDAASATGLQHAAGAAAVVDRQLALGTASTLTPYFVGASSQAEVAATLAQSVPLDNSALRTSQAALSAIGQAVQGRMSLAGPGGSSAGLWQQSFSYSGSRAEESGATGGNVIGVDTALSSTHRVGLGFAYANGNASSVSGSQQRDRFDLWQFLGYSSHRLDTNTEWMLYGGAGNRRMEAERTLRTGAGAGTAHARYDSLVATLGSSLAQTYRLSDTTHWMPSVRLDFNHVHEGSYRERGASGLQPLLLDVAARDTEQLIAGFDTRLEHQLAPGTQLRANLGIGYDLLNADGSRRAAFEGASDQPFTVTPERASPWLMRGGVGVTSTFRNGSELSLDWDTQSRSDYTDQTATVSMKVPF
ncbi:autotransporter family protein [Pseudomonas massiliensis]|uniref:autotransporter family protein n=2 Tax=Gammaproteobacteria TaxID=1236 RepID=UPI00058EA7A8|nr:autotransporter domain-containing protein [Pseudomonas massiliensis]